MNINVRNTRNFNIMKNNNIAFVHVYVCRLHAATQVIPVSENTLIPSCTEAFGSGFRRKMVMKLDMLMQTEISHNSGSAVTN